MSDTLAHNIQVLSRSVEVQIPKHYVRGGKLTAHGNVWAKGYAAFLCMRGMRAHSYSGDTMQNRGYANAYQKGWCAAMRAYVVRFVYAEEPLCMEEALKLAEQATEAAQATHALNTLREIAQQVCKVSRERLLLALEMRKEYVQAINTGKPPAGHKAWGGAACAS